MGFMDKVKAQAEQALSMAQQGVNQGQEKLGSMQNKHSADALLRELGAAFYAQQRTGGSGDAVQAALAAVDRHASEHGAIDTTPGATAGPTSAGPASGGTAPGGFAPGGSESAAPQYNAPQHNAPQYNAPQHSAPPSFNPPPTFNAPPSFEPPSQ